MVALILRTGKDMDERHGSRLTACTSPWSHQQGLLCFAAGGRRRGRFLVLAGGDSGITKSARGKSTHELIKEPVLIRSEQLPIEIRLSSTDPPHQDAGIKKRTKSREGLSATGVIFTINNNVTIKNSWFGCRRFHLRVTSIVRSGLGWWCDRRARNLVAFR